MTITKQRNALRKLRSMIAHLPLRSGRQIAAARAMVGLSQMDLAATGGWHPRTVRLWEAAPGLPTSHRPHLDKLIAIFAERGVAFTAAPVGVHRSDETDNAQNTANPLASQKVCKHGC